MSSEHQALLEIGGDPPLADEHTLEAYASRAYALAEEQPDPDSLAGALGATVLSDALPSSVDGWLFEWSREGAVIVLRSGIAPDARALALAHELAHLLLVRSGQSHTHGDVWCLTLALLFPRALCRRLRACGALNAGGLHAACPWAPLWTARVRMRMPAVELLLAA